MVAVAVCGLLPAAAFAAKLDNVACAALTDERNAITATGVKAEMDRGPEWAKANMPPERLQSALRLLEVEDQLEFRCARRGKPSKPEQTAVPATPPAPASGAPSAAVKNSAQDSAQDSTKAAEQPPPRVSPMPPTDQKSTSAPSMPAPTIQPPVALKPAHVVPAPPTQRTSAAPPAAAPSSPLVKPVNAPAGSSAAVAPAGPGAPATSAVNIPTQPAPVVAATPPVTAPVTEAAPNQQAIAVPIGPTPSVAPAGQSPQAAARKKKRNPSSAYVPPSEVNPFSLPGMR